VFGKDVTNQEEIKEVFITGFMANHLGEKAGVYVRPSWEDAEIFYEKWIGSDYNE